MAEVTQNNKHREGRKRWVSGKIFMIMIEKIKEMYLKGKFWYILVKLSLKYIKVEETKEFIIYFFPSFALLKEQVKYVWNDYIISINKEVQIRDQR